MREPRRGDVVNLDQTWNEAVVAAANISAKVDVDLYWQIMALLRKY